MIISWDFLKTCQNQNMQILKLLIYMYLDLFVCVLGSNSSKLLICTRDQNEIATGIKKFNTVLLPVFRCSLVNTISFHTEK